MAKERMVYTNKVIELLIKAEIISSCTYKDLCPNFYRAKIRVSEKIAEQFQKETTLTEKNRTAVMIAFYQFAISKIETFLNDNKLTGIKIIITCSDDPQIVLKVPFQQTN